MTKTKSQIRADAVERLRETPCAWSGDYIGAMLGIEYSDAIDRRSLRDALIDLLTDEETESIQNSEKDKFDTSDKLEADIERMVKEHGLYWIRMYIIEWLDRQAAIKEHEVLCHPDERDEQIAELQKQVDELEAECDARARALDFNLRHIHELQEKVEELEDKYAELLSEKVVSDETCDIFAEKLEAEKKRCAELEAELNRTCLLAYDGKWLVCSNCGESMQWFGVRTVYKGGTQDRALGVDGVRYCPFCGARIEVIE